MGNRIPDMRRVLRTHRWATDYSIRMPKRLESEGGLHWVSRWIVRALGRCRGRRHRPFPSRLENATQSRNETRWKEIR